MFIIIGADHAGLELKEKIKTWLTKESYDIVDVGAFALDEKDDFSKYVLLLRKCFDQSKDAKIIAICGTGIGMDIGLNKHKDIRCVVGHSEEEVSIAVSHNNINALALGGRTTTFAKAKKMIEVFLSGKALKGKYAKRMQDIEL